jgi:hypothetical protein
MAGRRCVKQADKSLTLKPVAVRVAAADRIK